MEITLATLQLIVTVWFSGHPVQCLIDSGSGASVIRQRVANRIPDLGEPVGMIGLVAVGGQYIEGRTYRVKHVGTRYIGWQDGKVLVFPDDRLPFDCLLGADYLARQNITMDWRAQEIYPAG